MPGQAIITIKDRQWAVDVAVTSWELSQGLGGIPELPAGTGMLFDLGYERTVQVTTVPMLFSLDIAFLSGDLTINEIYRDIAPGYLVTSQAPALYFLEVNAGELADIEPGDSITAEWLTLQETATVPDWAPAMFSLVGFTAMGVLVVGLAQDITAEATTGPETASLCVVEGNNAECEIVRPRHYELVSWVGAPVPDYSFAIEPEVKERRIDEVLKKLKEGVDGIQDSESFRKFLLTMSKFHDYSIGNLILITMQRPDATRVAGYNTWKDLGRWVKKGEKGIAILAPCLPPKSARVKEPEDEDEEEDKVIEIRPLYFKVVHVFEKTIRG